MYRRNRKLSRKTKCQRFRQIVTRFPEKIVRRKFKIRKRQITGSSGSGFRSFPRELSEQKFFQTAAECAQAHRLRNETDTVENRLPRLVHQVAEPLGIKFCLLAAIYRRDKRIGVTVPTALRGIIMQKIFPLTAEKPQMPRQRPGKFRTGKLLRKFRRGSYFAPEIPHCR